ncbi:MAG: DUF4214 domain-containing protein [Pyrinomonadaceae bacterium]
MYHRFTALLLTAVLIFSAVIPAHAYTLQFTNSSGNVQIKWPTTTITVALSPSLSSPPGNIKPGSDVVGAARRAMARWSAASNIRFAETSSSATSVGADGVNLITVTDNSSSLFPPCGSSTVITGRTRVFFNPDNGNITEADIAINPCLQFSTDGTSGTYDLESTFVHEFGHFLGLEHSAVVGATMQPRQGANGIYNLPALTARSLSYDDRAGIRAIYGPRSGGSIAGTVAFAGGSAVFGAHVWAEDINTGRIAASNLSLSNGAYRIDNLPQGNYRLVTEYLNDPIPASEISSQSGGYAGLGLAQPQFRTLEASSNISVTTGATTNFNIAVSTTTPGLNPRIFGINSQLSTIAVPIAPSRTYMVFVGGEGVDQVPASGISVTSGFVSVDPSTLRQYGTSFGTPYPIISFNVSVAESAAAGEYSIRLQSGTGEIAYVAGALTVDPAPELTLVNGIDDTTFFVTEQYRDFLEREPDAGGLSYWTSLITACGTDAQCIDDRRVSVSAAFFIEQEFQQSGSYVYRIYKGTLNRQPSFGEFLPDRRQVVGGSGLDASKTTYANNFVQRAEFLRLYPATLQPGEFIDKLLGTILTTSGVDLRANRTAYLNTLQQSGRGVAVRQVVEEAAFQQAEYNRAFVLMQYFGYLRRDPDAGGYNFWLDVLNNRVPNNYRAMVRAFITSAEYRQRFGQS